MLNSSHSVLVIEDEPGLLEAIKQVLESECLVVQGARNGKTALEKVSQQPFSLILIDMHLPDIFGLELFRQIKALSPITPCIFVSGHQIELDIVLSLQLGAEDYIIKPFKAGELLARIRKVLNRAPKGKPLPLLTQPEAAAYLSFNGLKLKQEQKDAYLHDQKMNLTKTEFEIFYFLASRPEEVMSREKILNQVWPTEETVTDRIVDTHIRQIRRKLKQALPDTEKYIITVRGVGYYFNPQPCK